MLNYRKSSLCKKRAIRAVNNSSFKAHSDPIFFRLELLNFDDTYKLGVGQPIKTTYSG